MNTDTKKILYNSTVASQMNYGDIIWNNCSKQLKDNLQAIQNSAAKRILPTTKSPGNNRMNELKWVTLEEKRQIHQAVFTK